MLKLRASIAAIVVALLSITTLARSEPEPQPVLLWSDGAPGALGKDDVDQPSLRIYLPDKAAATGTGVVVCPGGGYGHLAMDHEGRQIAEWLNTQGPSRSCSNTGWGRDMVIPGRFRTRRERCAM